MWKTADGQSRVCLVNSGGRDSPFSLPARTSQLFTQPTKRQQQAKRWVQNRAAAPSVEQIPKQENAVRELPAENQAEPFSWTKQWYPLAAVKDLDPTRPHAEMLLGEKLVLWRDKDEQWRCFEDACPHRLVPLSEGRIAEDGNLMCGYHGWTFKGDGSPATIPQLRSIDKERETKACSNLRACATQRPTQVRQGLLFVWGESGAAAEAESSATEAPLSTFREQNEDSVRPVFDQYIRDLPGSFEVWTENMQDQSHVPFSHHKVAGKRGGEKEGYLKMENIEYKPDQTKERGAAYALHFDWSMNGENTVLSHLYFKPPGLTAFHAAMLSLYIYAVPTSAHSTRLIINSVTKLPQKGKEKLLSRIPFFANLYRVLPHLVLNRVNQGDIVFMSGQHRAVGRTADQPGKHNYFLPSDADKGTAVWVRWLERIGRGGPKYANPAYTGEPFWGDNGKLRRHHVLDSYAQHTAKCTACSKLLEQVRWAQKAAYAAFGAQFLAVAAMLGRGAALWSPQILAVAGLAALTWVGLTKLRDLEATMTFKDWVQAELD